MAPYDDVARIAAGLERGCDSCGEPFDSNDLDYLAIHERRHKPGALVHTRCLDREITEALAMMLRDGRILRRWDYQAQEWRYYKSPSTPGSIGGANG